MNRSIYLCLVVACLLANTANGASLPSYYPAEGFAFTARVDAVIEGENRVIISDMSFQISTSVVVHSLSSYSDSLARIRKGAHVAYRLGKNRTIEEIWLLPNNYDATKSR